MWSKYNWIIQWNGWIVETLKCSCIILHLLLPNVYFVESCGQDIIPPSQYEFPQLCCLTTMFLRKVTLKTTTFLLFISSHTKRRGKIKLLEWKLFFSWGPPSSWSKKGRCGSFKEWERLARCTLEWSHHKVSGMNVWCYLTVTWWWN